MESAFRQVRDIRLALAALLALSMTGNVALTLGFAGRETVTVLVPATAGPSREVGSRGTGARVPRGHGAHRRGDAPDPDAGERGPRPPGGGPALPRLGKGRRRRLT